MTALTYLKKDKGCLERINVVPSASTVFKAAGKTQTKTNKMAFASTDKNFEF